MSNKNKSFGVNFREMENFFKYRRMPYPKRSAEFIALIAVSCTLFLFLHTKTLNSRLHEMEIKLQPSELSALGLTGSNSISNDDSKHDLKGVHGTYQYLKSTGQIKHTETYFLNNTRKAEVDIIIFNRVPKVGSQTLMELLRKLGRVNDFKTSRDTPKRQEQVLQGPMQQMELAAEILALEEPIVYSQHLAFINFTKLDLPRPIYINLVRDPIERVISWHYYIRSPWYYEQMRKKHGGDIKTPDETFMNMDFDTCVKTGDKACQFVQGSMKDNVGDHRRQSLFFCGHSRAACMPFNSKTALERAKRTVEEEYAVVGTWEDTNVTLSVLEHYIPKFFKHAKLAYYFSHDQLSKLNKNHEKKDVSEEVREMVKKNFTREIEFYQFCRQRLYKQYDALGQHQASADYDDSGEL